MRKLLYVVGFIAFTWWGVAAAQAPKKNPAAPAKAGAEQPKWKAVWEPANYPKDINLRDVQFISADEGWAVGDKNTILHTTDGAKSWKVQLGGDVDSTDRELTEVFFLDAKHGWTRGGAEKLLRTSDGGASWQELGRISQHELSLHFVSPQTGFTASSGISRTDDGGRTWKKMFPCKVETELDGLTRKADCYFRHMAFPSATAGYAVGQITGSGKRGVVARSHDGGNTWTASAPVAIEEHALRTFFWTDKSGLVTTYLGKTLLTTDGGDSWIGTVTPFGGGQARYAMAGGQLGVIILDKKIAYSINAGRTYSAREFPLPTKANAMVFPDAKRGYLVGNHGMIYRYHIVPADYNVKGMIPAPMVAGN